MEVGSCIFFLVSCGVIALLALIPPIRRIARNNSRRRAGLTLVIGLLGFVIAFTIGTRLHLEVIYAFAVIPDPNIREGPHPPEEMFEEKYKVDDRLSLPSHRLWPLRDQPTNRPTDYPDHPDLDDCLHL